MKHRIALGTLMALMVVFGVTATAKAAGPRSNATGVPGSGLVVQGTVASETFVDENGDGTCDSFVERVLAQDGTGSRWPSSSQYGTPASIHPKLSTMPMTRAWISRQRMNAAMQ